MRLRDMIKLSKLGQNIEEYLKVETEPSYYEGIFEDSNEGIFDDELEQYFIKNKITRFELADGFKYKDYIGREKRYYLLIDNEDENIGALVPYEYIVNSVEDDGNDVLRVLLKFNELEDAGGYVKELSKLVFWDNTENINVTFEHLKKSIQKTANEFKVNNKCIEITVDKKIGRFFMNCNTTDGPIFIKDYVFHCRFSLEKLAEFCNNNNVLYTENNQ